MEKIINIVSHKETYVNVSFPQKVTPPVSLKRGGFFYSGCSKHRHILKATTKKRIKISFTNPSTSEYTRSNCPDHDNYVAKMMNDNDNRSPDGEKKESSWGEDRMVRCLTG